MGPGCFFPTNPELADILGDTDFDFEIFFLLFLDPKFPDFQVPDFKISRNLSWAQLRPSLGPAWTPSDGPGPLRMGRRAPQVGPRVVRIATNMNNTQ